MFYDRTEAGRLLVKEVEEYRSENPVVIGLPRGGVPVAFEVAIALEAPLDVVVARKVGAPMQPELAIGAVAPEDVVLVDKPLVQYLGLSEEAVTHLINREREEIKRRILRFRTRDGLPGVKGRTVIVVDDGIATGLTALAAVAALRKGDPKRIVLAVPVTSAGAAQLLNQAVDRLIELHVPEEFISVGGWYEVFDPISDEEVVQLLDKARTSVR